MALDDNDKFNRRLFTGIFDAQLGHELAGLDRREFLRKERAKALGAYRKVLDRILRLDDDQLHRFFEKVMEEYGI